jgi:hypothetical protein
MNVTKITREQFVAWEQEVRARAPERLALFMNRATLTSLTTETVSSPYGPLTNHLGWASGIDVMIDPAMPACEIELRAMDERGVTA